ncbi:hypothetical protein HELRODRAFT_113191 [Helobdella robusta]|uniref:Innexin n=1 Tax=Helobdella robusta TaxID=6412 RepID=T1EFQ7_HELRO|nr:hypothetical protein HELRODRAFT_113191 [Helobdella robusta]ESO00665.1 hypothetical protein HELRODRAFT_113191 [Helobdella robusta]
MDRLVSLIAGASSVRSSNDDDFADRLSSRYTVVLLVLFAVLVGMNQYVRNPITCWAPVHFTGPHTKFATNFCWVKNTYYLPWQNEVPREMEKKQMIPYYQWVPFILLFQAVLFYLPTIVWHGMNSKAGIDADSIMQSAHSLSRMEKSDAHKRTMLLLTNQMDRFLSNRLNRKKGCGCNTRSCFMICCCGLCGRRLGNYLVILFLFSKFCYIVNILAQLFVLNGVLSIKFNTFGVDLIRLIMSTDDWTEQNHVAFPRVTYCDFYIRGQDMANVQPYTIQCVLPINLYNEKIYFFLWFWMVFVLLASTISFFLWFMRALFFRDRLKFIRNHLLLGSRVNQIEEIDEKSNIREFASRYLKQDGTFLLRLIAHNTNNITTTEIICGLWDYWLRKSEKVDTMPDTMPISRLYPTDVEYSDELKGKEL